MPTTAEQLAELGLRRIPPGPYRTDFVASRASEGPFLTIEPTARLQLCNQLSVALKSLFTLCVLLLLGLPNFAFATGDVRLECELRFAAFASKTGPLEGTHYAKPKKGFPAPRWVGFPSKATFKLDSPRTWSNKDRGRPWPGASPIDSRTMVLIGMIQAAHHYWSYPIQREIFVDQYGEQEAFTRFKEKFFEGFHESYEDDEYVITFDRGNFAYSAKFFEDFLPPHQLHAGGRAIVIPAIVGFTRISKRSAGVPYPWETFLGESPGAHQVQPSEETTNRVEVSRLITTPSAFGTDPKLILLTHYSGLFGRLIGYEKDQQTPVVLAAALTAEHVRYFQKKWGFKPSGIPKGRVPVAASPSPLKFVLLENQMSVLILKLQGLVDEALRNFRDSTFPKLTERRTDARTLDQTSAGNTLLFGEASLGSESLRVFLHRGDPEVNQGRPQVYLQGTSDLAKAKVLSYSIEPRVIQHEGYFANDVNWSETHVERKVFQVTLRILVQAKDRRKTTIELTTSVPIFTGKVSIFGSPVDLNSNYRISMRSTPPNQDPVLECP